VIAALDLIASRYWLIVPDALERMLAIAARDFDHEALVTRAGVPLGNTRTVSKRPNGTAVIPITGPIFRRANLLTSISGATSTEVLATDFQAAMDDPAVKSIVLEIDSPGGEANGINELAQLIYDSRGKKPITAYIGGTGASAAYWLASAADSIVADPTAIVGSIGVVSEVVDSTQRDAKNGVRTFQIVSSNAPNKRPDPATDAGRAQYQAVVDDLEKTFLASVARNRGTAASKVVSDFGAGGVKVGAAALKAGMIDRLGSLEQTIAQSGSQIVNTRTATISNSSSVQLPAVHVTSSPAEQAEVLRICRAAKASENWGRTVAKYGGKLTAEPPDDSWASIVKKHSPRA